MPERIIREGYYIDVFAIVGRRRPLKELHLDSDQLSHAAANSRKTEPHTLKEFLKMRLPWMRDFNDWALLMEVGIGTAMMLIWLITMVSLWHGIIFLLNITQG